MRGCGRNVRPRVSCPAKLVPWPGLRTPVGAASGYSGEKSQARPSNTIVYSTACRVSASLSPASLFCAIARRRGRTGSTKSNSIATGSSSTSRAMRLPFSPGTDSISQAATKRSLAPWRQSRRNPSFWTASSWQAVSRVSPNSTRYISASSGLHPDDCAARSSMCWSTVVRAAGKAAPTSRALDKCGRQWSIEKTSASTIWTP